MKRKIPFLPFAMLKCGVKKCKRPAGKKMQAMVAAFVIVAMLATMLPASVQAYQSGDFLTSMTTQESGTTPVFTYTVTYQTTDGFNSATNDNNQKACYFLAECADDVIGTPAAVGELPSGASLSVQNKYMAKLNLGPKVMEDKTKTPVTFTFSSKGRMYGVGIFLADSISSTRKYAAKITITEKIGSQTIGTKTYTSPTIKGGYDWSSEDFLWEESDATFPTIASGRVSVKTDIIIPVDGTQSYPVTVSGKDQYGFDLGTRHRIRNNGGYGTTKPYMQGQIKSLEIVSEASDSPVALSGIFLDGVNLKVDSSYNADSINPASARFRIKATVGYGFSMSGGKTARYFGPEKIFYSDVITLSKPVYTIKFVGNGADGGSMPPQTVYSGVQSVLNANTFTRTGYEFAGWGTSETGEAAYSDKDGIKLSLAGDSILLYAKWTPAALTGTVNITGSMRYGETLTADVSESNNTGTFSYQWYRGETAIDGAVGSSYRLTLEDIGKSITCAVTSSVQTGSIQKSTSGTVADAEFSLGEISCFGHDGVYNGNAYGISVTVPVGATVRYGTTDGTYTFSESPKYSNAGTYTVYYQVTKEGYVSVSGSAQIKIKKADLTITAKDKEIIYGMAPDNAGVNYMGFVNGESASVLGGALEFDYTYTQYGDVGADYEILPKGIISDNYECHFVNGKLTVEQKQIDVQWEKAENVLIYNGTAQAPKATVNGAVNGDAVSLVISGAETNVGEYIAKVTGISGEKAANYKLPTDHLSQSFKIIQGSQSAPALLKQNETICGKADGKITGVNDQMEYRRADSDFYTAITGTEITNLMAGTYLVRYKAGANYAASPEAEIVISAGRKLLVTLPETQTGYTLVSDKSEFCWNEDVKLTFTLKDGYSKENFAVKVNGVPVSLVNDEYTIGNAKEDLDITVEGVADITPPEGEILLGTNRWNKFLNTITFGLFFKETQSVTITGVDVNTGSGVDKIEYVVVNEAVADAKALTGWKEYKGNFSIEPDQEAVIYARITDKAGNRTCISSDGIVLDGTAPVISGIEHGKTYYGDVKIQVKDAYLDTVTVDGKPVTVENDYITISADNALHTVNAVDKAGNETSCTIDVYKIYTVTFQADGNIVAVVSVNHGAGAKAPAIPMKEGYTQTEPYWDKAFDDVTQNLTVNAVYTINRYVVTLPATQTGYTVVSDKSEFYWNEDVKLTFTLKDGYSKENFAVKVNGVPVSLVNDEYTIGNAKEDLDITVEGVADITPPEGELLLGTNRWNKFLNTITFGLFFKETQSVTITGVDVNTGSGVDKIEYVVVNEAAADAKTLTGWKEYEGSFSIEPDQEAVIYARITDKAGNRTCISSDGIVLDGTAPVISGIEHGKTYYGDVKIQVKDAYLDTVTVDGKPVTVENDYITISADNASHTVKAVDKAGNETSYTIHVYKKSNVTGSPETGDKGNNLFWAVLLVVSGITFFGIVVYKKRKI